MSRKTSGFNFGAKRFSHNTFVANMRVTDPIYLHMRDNFPHFDMDRDFLTDLIEYERYEASNIDRISRK